MIGRLDAAQCEAALRLLDGVAAADVIDLRGLDYISSAGLGVLLKTQKRAVAGGKGLRLINANKHIHDIFQYAGFDRIFEIVPGPVRSGPLANKADQLFAGCRVLMSEDADGRDLARCCEGDRRAFADLVSRYQKRSTTPRCTCCTTPKTPATSPRRFS